jgi:hypothetical protein
MFELILANFKTFEALFAIAAIIVLIVAWRL